MIETVGWVLGGWLFTWAIYLAIGILLVDPRRRHRALAEREAEPEPPPPLTREQTWELGLPWVSDAGELEWASEGWTVDGPDVGVHAELHARRERAEQDRAHQEVAIEYQREVRHRGLMASLGQIERQRRLKLTLTPVDVLYIAGTWQHNHTELPSGTHPVHLPSGRVLTGQEVGDFVRWLRWREGRGDLR